jgi:hypothetical protein
MRRPVSQIRAGSLHPNLAAESCEAGNYAICGPADVDVQSGHECLGARQTHGGQQNADSSSPEWLATALLATTDTFGNQRARALPASPLAPPLDTRSQASTTEHVPMPPKGRSVHVVGVAHGLRACPA